MKKDEHPLWDEHYTSQTTSTIKDIVFVIVVAAVIAFVCGVVVGLLNEVAP